MNGHEVCVCGDVADEHGGNPKYPGSTACKIKKCGCIAFELDEEATQAAENGDADEKAEDPQEDPPEAKKRRRLPPIAERIDTALKNGPLHYTDLWDKVFPADDFPRRGGTPSRGGPPGSYMALSRAIDKYGFRWSVPDGQKLAGRIVYPRRKRS